jgi:hypothetical protein
MIIWIVIQLIDSIKTGCFSELFGAIGIAFTSILAYIIGLNSECKTKQFLTLLELYLSVICFQTIAESLMGDINFLGDPYYYKHDLITPIGASNYIATKIVPLFIFAFSLDENARRRLFLLALSFVALILTKSRNGLLCFSIVFILFITFNNKTSGFKKLFTIFLLLVLFLYFIQKGVIGDLTATYSNSSSTVDGRINLWIHYIVQSFRYPLLGHGIERVDGYISSHNMVLDIFFRGGIIGSFIFVIGLNYYLSRMSSNNQPVATSSKFFLIAEFLISMAEITFFTVTNDVFFFFIIGLAISCCQSSTLGCNNDQSSCS